MASWRTPAEWMKPVRFGVFALTNSSTLSLLETSHFSCSTLTPSSPARRSTSLQLGMSWSLTLQLRDRNLMLKRLPPCFFALPRRKMPMTRPRPALPPEMAMTPSSGTTKSSAYSYSFDGTFRCTYRPPLRMRTVLWPKDQWRKTSALMCFEFSVLRAHSVSMYWIGHGHSILAVLAMPKRAAFVMRPRPHSSWISLSCANASTVRTASLLQRVASSPIFRRIHRKTLTTASCSARTSSTRLLAGGSIPVAKMIRSHECMLTSASTSFLVYFSADLALTFCVPMRPGGACWSISVQ
mmetsp:Transcript_83036/g.235561  ORF Transcript_83036/g.235561 Transcript_83036/m.235561 type:complete len:296 (-) Transcript_83036:382-1269(-)